MSVFHEDEVIINNNLDPTKILLDVDVVVYAKLLLGSEQLEKRFHWVCPPLLKQALIEYFY